MSLEIAGTIITTEAEQKAYGFIKASVDPVKLQGPNSVAAFKEGFAQIAVDDMASAVAVTEAMSFDINPLISQTLAPYAAMVLRDNDREVGNRMLYSFLSTPEIRSGTKMEIDKAYNAGKLSYEEYYPFDMKCMLELIHDGLRHS